MSFNTRSSIENSARENRPASLSGIVDAPGTVDEIEDTLFLKLNKLE